MNNAINIFRIGATCIWDGYALSCRVSILVLTAIFSVVQLVMPLLALADESSISISVTYEAGERESQAKAHDAAVMKLKTKASQQLGTAISSSSIDSATDTSRGSHEYYQKKVIQRSFSTLRIVEEEKHWDGHLYHLNATVYYDKNAIKSYLKRVIDEMIGEGDCPDTDVPCLIIAGNSIPLVYVPEAEKWLSKFEISNKLYLEFLRSSNYDGKGEADGNYLDDWQTGQAWYRSFARKDPSKIIPSKPNAPLVYVSWQNATAFCKWVSKNTGYLCCLPRERELDAAFNMKSSSGGDIVQVVSVSSVTPDEFWEFCKDYYDEYHESIVVKRFSWRDKGADRISKRAPYRIYRTWDNVGFRIAVNVGQREL